MNDQLNLFELSVLRATQSTSETSGVYPQVQRAMGVSDDETNRTIDVGGGRKASEWKRKVRWVQQTLKKKNYLVRGNQGWKLTGKGKRTLTQRTGGMEIAFMTVSGVALWGEANLCSGLYHGEVDLIVTSPEYLLAKPKEYSRYKAEDEYIEDLLHHFESWIPMLTSTGSIVLNIADAFINDGNEMSLYKEKLLLALQERLGLSLMQRFEAFNPTKLPNPMGSVAVRRTHCINSLETFYWLTPNPDRAKSNNRNVLLNYSDMHSKAMASHKVKAAGLRRKVRPSGNSVNPASIHKDNMGSIPANLLTASPAGANHPYSKYCEKNQLPVHPCRFSESLPQFFIDFLTDAGDFIYDPFSGSCLTGFCAETSGRYWSGSDRILEYLLGAAGRFENPTIMI